MFIVGDLVKRLKGFLYTLVETIKEFGLGKDLGLRLGLELGLELGLDEMLNQ